MADTVSYSMSRAVALGADLDFTLGVNFTDFTLKFTRDLFHIDVEDLFEK